MAEEDEIERKFLLSGFLPPCDWPVPSQVSIIQQTYLKSSKDGVSERVRRRRYVDDNRIVFTHTFKRWVGEGHNKEDEREVGELEFLHLRERAHPDHLTIHKVRRTFTWAQRLFELDVFLTPEGIYLLEVELPSLDALVEMPTPIVTLDREVTGDKSWSNEALSRRDRWS